MDSLNIVMGHAGSSADAYHGTRMRMWTRHRRRPGYIRSYRSARAVAVRTLQLNTWNEARNLRQFARGWGSFFFSSSELSWSQGWNDGRLRASDGGSRASGVGAYARTSESA